MISIDEFPESNLEYYTLGQKEKKIVQDYLTVLNQIKKLMFSQLCKKNNVEDINQCIHCKKKFKSLRQHMNLQFGKKDILHKEDYFEYTKKYLNGLNIDKFPDIIIPEQLKKDFLSKYKDYMNLDEYLYFSSKRLEVGKSYFPDTSVSNELLDKLRSSKLFGSVCYYPVFEELVKRYPSYWFKGFPMIIVNFGELNMGATFVSDGNKTIVFDGVKTNYGRIDFVLYSPSKKELVSVLRSYINFLKKEVNKSVSFNVFVKDDNNIKKLETCWDNIDDYIVLTEKISPVQYYCFKEINRYLSLYSLCIVTKFKNNKELILVNDKDCIKDNKSISNNAKFFIRKKASLIEISSVEGDFCGNFVESKNKRYTVAFCDSVIEENDSGEEIEKEGDVYLIENKNKILWCKKIGRPHDPIVTNDGVVIISDWCIGNKLNGKLHVFNWDGKQLLTYNFSSNIGGQTYIESEKILKIITLSPDKSVYSFDLRNYLFIKKEKQSK